jgi:SNF2 family DNA or RNA helicase
VQEVAIPDQLQATLRDYQREGVSWLQFLREHELGGILADDMGLGKTIQALTHILIEKQAGRLDRPALVIAPTSLFPNWLAETKRFAPSLRVLGLHGADRAEQFDQITDHDLVITTYPLLVRDAIFVEMQWHLVILDEAHYIKNPAAKMAQAARGLQTRHRVCLTGTPMENHVGELWSLFEFLMPGLLHDQRNFARYFRNPIEKRNDTERRSLLSSRVTPFILRRTKDLVAGELPKKTEMLREIELAKDQRDLYETVRIAMDKRVRDEIAKKGMARSRIIVLDALLKLRQVCCDPRLVKVPSAKKVKHSAKLDALLEMVDSLLEEGRRILIFSQFTSMLALIESALEERRITYVKLTGATRDRRTPVEQFQALEVPIFLISLKAGGTGLNLTAADTVIHYDPWWNPAVERQATDRAHRLGQEKPVFVYKLVAKGSVEERILAIQERKGALAEALFDPEKTSKAEFSQDDIEALFRPLE